MGLRRSEASPGVGARRILSVGIASSVSDLLETRACQFVSSSLMGSLGKGFFSRKVLRKICGNLHIASGKGAESLRNACINFAEICGEFSSMTPSRTAP